MGRQMAKGGEWGELPGYAPGEARPSTVLGTHPFRLTVPPSLFLLMVGFPVTLASCSKKRCWKDHSSACNPASHSIAQHHPALPSITQHYPVLPQPGAQADQPQLSPLGPGPGSPCRGSTSHSRCSAEKQGRGWRWAAPRRSRQSRRRYHTGHRGGRRAGAAGEPKGAAPWGGPGSAAAAGRDQG